MKVLYFSASWCGPCKVFKPTVQKVSQNMGINVNYIDADASSDLTQRYAINSVPTIMILDSYGNEIYRNSGVMSESQLSSIFNSHMK